MHRNNLRFAAATGQDRGAYHLVFDMMVRYYLDVKAAAVGGTTGNGDRSIEANEPRSDGCCIGKDDEARRTRLNYCRSMEVPCRNRRR